MTSFSITKVKEPVKFVDIEVLKRCSAGLTKRIIKSHYSEKARLRLIREEIDYLINQL